MGRYLSILIITIMYVGFSVAQAADVPSTQPAFSASGKILNHEGQPVEGAKIVAHCGEGTLLITGETTSGADGTYTLHFRRGIYLMGEEHRVPTQAAVITAHKAGYFEKNLCRQGDMVMTDDPQKTFTRAAGVVRPSQPVTIDFTLLPAATVKGVLLNSAGKPIRTTILYLVCKPLPPASSVVASCRTDLLGRFTMTDIPTGRALWFSIRFSGQPLDVLSDEFVASEATVYPFCVTLPEAKDGSQKSKLKPMSATEPAATLPAGFISG